MVVLLEGSPISTEELWSSVSDHRVIGHLPDQGHFPPVAQFGGADSSRKSIGGSKRWRPLCSWGPSMPQNYFGTLPQICASTQSCVGALRTIPSTHGLVFVLTCTVICGTLYGQVCA